VILRRGRTFSRLCGMTATLIGPTTSGTTFTSAESALHDALENWDVHGEPDGEAGDDATLVRDLLGRETAGSR